METKKISDFEIEITKTESKEIVNKYDRTFIENQIVAIQKQADDFAQARQTELDECNSILKAMDDEGIINRPIEIKSTVESIEQISAD